jgi:nucleoside-diphosphate-sugar epimerase
VAVRQEAAQGGLRGALHADHRINAGTGQLRRVFGAVAEELQVAAGRDDERLVDRVVALGEVHDGPLPLERHGLVDRRLDRRRIGARRHLDHRPRSRLREGHGHRRGV